jgi:hypothetical protein
MAKVMVYKVKVYDITNDSTMVSRRMATRKGAAMMRGEVIEDSATEVDEARLENGGQWTAVGFNPHPRTGFQQQVMS